MPPGHRSSPTPTESRRAILHFVLRTLRIRLYGGSEWWTCTALQRDHRQRAKNPAFQDDYRTHRPMVEESIAWLTRDNRRVPHRGTNRNNAWLQLRIAGLNLRRLLRLGLTSDQGSWAIA
jgi:hypothetical protein